MSKQVEISGVCTFHSETGTEGGYWAVQDEVYMNLPTDDEVSCTRCGRIWNRTKDPDNPPAPSFTYYRPGWTREDGVNVIGGYAAYDEPHPELSTIFKGGEEGDLNDRYIKETNRVATLCYKMGHKGWKELYPEGMWSYEGLHVLKDGDHLTVYDRRHPEKTLWSGLIRLKRHPLFTEHASGLWIHADQVGIRRDRWANYFFQEMPCKLVTEENPPAPSPTRPAKPRRSKPRLEVTNVEYLNEGKDDE